MTRHAPDDFYVSPTDELPAVPEDDFESFLGQAIHAWQSGNHIPLDVAAGLMEQGYDVGALESRYFQH